MYGRCAALELKKKEALTEGQHCLDVGLDPSLTTGILSLYCSWKML